MKKHCKGVIVSKVKNPKKEGVGVDRSSEKSGKKQCVREGL